MLNNQIDVDDYMQDFRTYLGINEALTISVDVDIIIPNFTVDIHQAIQLAFENHPRLLNIQLRKLESERNVASAKANTGLRADIYAQFGLTQTGDELDVAYQKPLNQQFVQLGLRLPILDWGRRKGQIRVAESRRDMVFTQEDQNLSDFEQNVIKTVKQFNLQNGNVVIASKMDETAQRNSEVSRQLYLLGRLSVTDLNTSVRDKDNAKRNYINSIYNYWSLYYLLRSLTLYDFEKNIALTEDYEALIK
jgi:outer membrane protein TolC